MKKINTVKLLDFCTKNGILVKVNNNPSPEEISRIQNKIKESDEKLKNAMFTMSSQGVRKSLEK